MTEAEIKNILEQQLQLLSERSKATENNYELCSLTSEMNAIANLLLLYCDEQSLDESEPF